MGTSEAYNSIHDGPAIDAAVTRASEGGPIDAAIQAKPNHNLLDNWYFANPVNQRGLTKYNTGGSSAYTIDRWKARNADCSVVVEGDGVRVTCTSTANNLYFEQYIEPTVDDMPVYSSALVTEVTGTVYMQLAYADGTYSKAEGALKAGLKEIQCTKPVKRVMFRIYKNGCSVKIKAAKLEYGNRQTLAHKDADGNWVLNDIPDYGEQLLRCQRYFQLYSAADKRPVKAVDCRPVMRANPSQGTIAIGDTTYYYNTADL